MPGRETVIVREDCYEQQDKEKIGVRNKYCDPGQRPASQKHGCYADCRSDGGDDEEDEILSCLFPHGSSEILTMRRPKNILRHLKLSSA